MIKELHVMTVGAFIAHNFLSVKNGKLVRLSKHRNDKTDALIDKLGLNIHMRVFEEKFIEILMDSISQKFNCLVHHTIAPEEDYIDFKITTFSKIINCRVYFDLYLDQAAKYGRCPELCTGSEYSFSQYILSAGKDLNHEFARYDNIGYDLDDVIDAILDKFFSCVKHGDNYE